MADDTKKGFFKRLKQGLRKTHQAVTRRIDELTFGKREIDPALLDQIEEILLTADMGVATTDALMESLRWQVDRKQLQDPARLHDVLKEELYAILSSRAQPLVIDPACQPYVILTVGVNGTGKTTTIAKIAHMLLQNGHSVELAAADTFRAAAIDQLGVWADRLGCRLVKHKPGADPSAVAFDAVQSAAARQIDVVIVDTAGRLHTKVPLMEEIRKVHRVLGKVQPGAPHETLLVLDATTGQNAINQARQFKEAVDVTGLALTKLDGTAKGGVIVGISRSLALPIRYIGVGEQLDDLRPFDARDFVEALFSA